MRVGDLVRHNGMNDVVWHGVVTKTQRGINLFHVVWTFGDQGWFYGHSLEVLCE